MAANIKPRKRAAYQAEQTPIRFDVVTVGNILLGHWPDDAPGLMVAIDDKGCELSEQGVEKLVAHLQQWLEKKVLTLPKPPEPFSYTI